MLYFKYSTLPVVSGGVVKQGFIRWTHLGGIQPVVPDPGPLRGALGGPGSGTRAGHGPAGPPAGYGPDKMQINLNEVVDEFMSVQPNDDYR